MTIIFPNNEFVYELFPEAKGNQDELEKSLTHFYTLGTEKPIVHITEDVIRIDLPTGNSEKSKKMDLLVSLCERGKLEEAKVLASELIQENPEVSEYHRLLGQVNSDLGDQEEAINTLIDALRWDPENEWALIMMGNIFAKYKDDVETAMTYYNQVLKIKPDDNIALNNIGANLVQNGKLDEAIIYFDKAHSADPEYPNTYYAFALIAEMKEDFLGAFEFALKALEKNHRRDQLYGNSFRMAIDAATEYKKNFDAQKIVENFGGELSEKGKNNIRIEEDSSIPTAAKIEFAENYNRDYHLVKYKPNYPAVEHLVMHELMHLELAIEAREAKENRLFISNDNFKSKFFYSLEKEAKKLKKEGISEDSIANFLNALFEGINRQVFNTPIDLFIEDRIYSRFPKFRPLQFISILALIQEGIQATTRKEIVKDAPSAILSKSKIFNLTNAIHFRELFKIDLVNDHKPTKIELRQAEEFYKEYLEYREDKQPGEEYELVKHWGEDLGLDGYFELVSEEEYRRPTLESVMSEIQKNPLGVAAEEVSDDRKMKQFLEEHANQDINIAVAMYMVDALQFFKDKKQPEIKKIAFEVATIGMAGIDPKKSEGYEIPSINGSNFSGYKTLAYYYVSWALSGPELVDKLGVPFEKEYDLAQKFLKI